MTTGQWVAEMAPTRPTGTVSAAAARAAGASASAPATISRQTNDCSSERPTGISHSASGSHLRAEMACNFRASGLPYFLMAGDVGKRGIEGADAMRHAGEIGV